MSNTQYLELVNTDTFVNDEAIGDPTSNESGLRISITVPSDTVVGEFMLILVEGPAGVTTIVRQITAQQFNSGQFSVFMPSASITDSSGEHADGDYTLTLASASIGGGLSLYEGTANFTLDTLAPDAPTSVSIDTGDDEFLNVEELSAVVPVNVGVPANADIGDIIHVDVDGDGIAEATHTIVDGDAGTIISIDVDGADYAIEDGRLTADVSITDPALNVSNVTDTTYAADNLAPTQIVNVQAVIDDQQPNMGLVESGGTTNDLTPSLNGRVNVLLSEQEHLNVYRNGELIGQAVVSGSGLDIVWEFVDEDDTDPLAHGNSYIYSVRVEDEAGNVGPLSNEYTITIDTVNPTQTGEILNVIDDVDVPSNVASNGFTDDTAPQLTGSLSDALAQGEQLDVLRNGSIIGQAVVDATDPDNITWVFDDSGLLDGESYEYEIQVQDAAGNTGPLSQVYNINIDTVNPSQTVTITNVVDDEGVTADVASGGNTDDHTPLIQGTISAILATGEVLNILRDGVVIGQAIVDASDTANVSWSYQDSGLSDGNSYSYQVQVVDAALNFGPLSSAYTINVDSMVPPQIVIITNVLDDVDTLGNVASGGSTDDTSPQLQGTLSANLAAGEVLNVLRDDVIIGQATIDASDVDNVVWDFLDSGLTDGVTYDYQVQIQDSADNLGALSNTYTISIDTTDPEQLVQITNVIDDVNLAGNISSGGVTDDTSPQIVGSINAPLAAGEVLDIIRNGAIVGLGTVDVSDPANIVWSFDDSGLADATTYEYQVQVRDAADNLGPLSNLYSIVIDTSAPVQMVVITNVVDDVDVIGDVASGGSTDDTTPQIQGTISADLDSSDELNVLRDNVVIGQAVIDATDPANITWYFNDAGLANGDTYSYQVQLQDLAGNVGDLSNVYIISIDTENPAQTATISNIIDDVNGTSDLSSGDTTDDTAPELIGGLSAPLIAGEVLNIIRDGEVIGQAEIDTTDPDNITWNYEDSGLADGESYNYQVQVADAASNFGPISDVYNINVDTTGPDQSAVITNVADDEDVVSDVISGGFTDDTSPQLQGTLSGVLNAGEVLNVIREGTVIGQATVNVTDPNNVIWVFNDTDLVDGTRYDYQVQVVDSAGATGDLSNTYTINIDTQAPTQTAVINNIVDNVEGISDIADGGATNDTTPQLQGSLSDELTAGEELCVLRDGELVGVATIDDTDPDNIIWSFTDAGLTDGNSYEYQVQVQDAALNLGALSNSYTINVDTSDPTQSVTVINVVDDVDIVGDVASGGSTDDTAPQIQGELSAPLLDGEVLNVIRDGVIIGQAVVDATDPIHIVWSYDDSGLADGETYNYQVQVEDAAGNTGVISNTYTISIDTTDPLQLAVITNVVDDLNVPGNVSSGDSTDDTTPTLEGTLNNALVAGEVLNVLRDGLVVGQAVVDDADLGNITWSFEDSGLANGETYDYQVQVEDAAHNFSDLSNTYSISIDTANPDQVAVITNVVDDVDVVGNVTSGGTTDDTAPELQGTLDSPLLAGELLNVLRAGVVIGQASVDATDTDNIVWSYQDSGLEDGNSYNYQVQVIDSVDNLGELSNTYTIDIDITDPTQTAVITNVIDDEGAVSNVASGDSTDDSSPELEGTLSDPLAPGEVLNVIRNGTVIGVAIVDDSNPAAIVWTYQDSDLETGSSYAYQVQVQDAADNAGAMSNTYTIEIDFILPSQAVAITNVLDDVDVTGNVSSGGFTDDTAPEIQGTINDPLLAGEVLNVLRNGVVVGQASVDETDPAAISWSYQDSGLSDGVEYDYQVQIEDAAGNLGLISNTYSINIDTSDPLQTAVITNVVDNEGELSNIASGGTTDDTTPQLQGTLSAPLVAGEVLNVLSEGVLIGQAIVDDSNPAAITWSYQDGVLADGGTYEYTVQVQDLAGNLGDLSNTYIIVIDTSNPEQLAVITNVIDNVDGTENIASGGDTDDTDPELEGTLSAALADLEVLNVLRDGVVIGQATIDASNPAAVTWHYQDAGLSDGNTYQYQVQVQDAADNLGDLSNIYSINVDTSNPPQIVAITNIVDDVDVVGDISSGGSTDDTSPELQGEISAPLQPGEVLNVLRDGVIIGQANVDISDPINLVWNYQDSGLADGETYQYQVQVQDAAGNTGVQSNTYIITVDTSSPLQTGEITNIVDDFNVPDNVSSGETTDDRSPTLEGSLNGVLAAGEVLNILRDGEVIGQAVIDDTDPDNVIWSYEDSGLENGETYNYQVQVEDGAHNFGDISAPYTINVDTSDPDQIAVITNAVDDVDVVGDVASGETTDDTAPMLEGTLTGPLLVGEVLNIIRGGAIIGQAAVDATDLSNIVWSYQDSALVDGNSYAYQAQVMDLVGNTGDLSNTFTLNIDTTDPLQVGVITNVVDDVDGTTDIASGGTTDDIAPELEGTLNSALADGEVLNVLRDGVVVGQAVIDASNLANITWSFQEGGLEDGSAYNYQVQVADLAGNTGGLSNTYNINVDITNPIQTAIITNVVDDVDLATDVSTGGVTDDTAPELQGSLSASLVVGEVLNVIRNGTVIGQATIDNTDPANVSWSYQDSGLSDDTEYVYQVQVQDAADNLGELSNSYSINIDISNPEQMAVITNVVDDEGTTVNVASGGSTDDTSPELQGTLDAVLAVGEVVDVIREGVVVGQAVVDAANPAAIIWSYQDSGLADGDTYQYQVQVRDLADNVGALSNTYIINIDISAPPQTAVITNIIDDVEVTGNVASGEATDDTAPELEGTLSAMLGGGEQLNVLRNGVVIGQASVDVSNPANVSWSYQDSGLSDGNSYDYQVQVMDAALNGGELSNTYRIVIDTTDPLQTGQITNVVDDVGVMGNLASGDTTDDTDPQLQGSLEGVLALGDVLNVLRDGVVVGQATVDDTDPDNLTWSYQDAGLSDGETYEYHVQVEDSAHNTGDLSDPFSISIDTSGPDQTAEITNVVDDVDVTGNVENGGATDDTAPLLEGTLSADLAVGDSLNVLRDNVVIGQAVVDSTDSANIIWSYADSGLSDGNEYNYHVQVIDLAENTGDLSDGYSINIDTSAPSQLAVINNVVDDVDGAQDIQSGGTTDDIAPQVEGSLTAALATGEVLNVLRDDVVIGQATIDATNPAAIVWSYQDSALEDGNTYVYQVQVEDSAHNFGELSNAYSIVVDTSNPLQVGTITNVVDDVDVTADIESGGTTDDTSPELQGTLDAVLDNGDVLNVLSEGVVIGQATVDASDPANITWSYQDSGLVDGGTYIYEVQVEDLAGNLGALSDSYTITIDTTDPTQVAEITNVFDDVDVTGNVASGETTDDIAPQVQGTLSASLHDSEELIVLRNGVVVGEALVDDSNPDNITWIFNDTGLENGLTYEYQVQVQDSAANPGPLSNTYTISIDDSAPEQVGSIESVIDNVAPDEGQLASGDSTNDITPELQGVINAPLEAGEVLDVLRDGQVIGQATIDPTDPTVWNFVDNDGTDPLVDGQTYVYTVQVNDGTNTGELSQPFSLIIDTTSPDPVEVDLDRLSDTHLVYGSFSEGTKDDDITLDKTPEFSGQVSASEAGSVVVYYAYATQALPDGSDSGLVRELIENQDAALTYTDDDRFVLGSAVVAADGSWLMSMEDTQGSPTLSTQSLEVDGITVQKFFMHVSAVMTDTAGNVGEESSDLDITIETRAVNSATVDPLILDLNGDGAHTSSILQNSHFDHDADGDAEYTGWVDAEDGLLVLDLNHDGIINDGRELFGDEMLLNASNSKAVDGFEALAQYDSDANNVIDSNDAIFEQLQVWVDANQDGVTDEGELQSLNDLAITEISLATTDVTISDNGNSIIKTSSFIQDGQQREIVDALFEKSANSEVVDYVELLLDGDVVSSEDIGDGSGIDSKLQVVITLPPQTLSGQYLLLAVTGPNGSNYIEYSINSADFSLGTITLSVPNSTLQTDGVFVDGGYSVSFLIGTLGGSVEVYPSEASFTLDAHSADTASVMQATHLDEITDELHSDQAEARPEAVVSVVQPLDLEGLETVIDWVDKEDLEWVSDIHNLLAELSAPNTAQTPAIELGNGVLSELAVIENDPDLLADSVQELTLSLADLLEGEGNSFGGLDQYLSVAQDPSETVNEIASEDIDVKCTIELASLVSIDVNDVVQQLIGNENIAVDI